MTDRTRESNAKQIQHLAIWPILHLSDSPFVHFYVCRDVCWCDNEREGREKSQQVIVSDCFWLQV